MKHRSTVIRPAVYQGRPGFSIVGRDKDWDNRVRLHAWVDSKEEAQRVAFRWKGQSERLFDMEFPSDWPSKDQP